MTQVERTPLLEAIPAAPAAAVPVFGARLPDAIAYAQRLAGDGIRRGLIGPRELPRLWERHLLNCAAVAVLLPRNARVVDVGSGAGLPGIPLALARPDLRLELVEPQLRRVTFLQETVAELGLGDQIEVIRGRADSATVRRSVGDGLWVTARAVAPLDRLVTWCLPLLRQGGHLLALKGAQASVEVDAHRAAVKEEGGSILEVRELMGESPGSSTFVVIVERASGAERRPGS